MAKPLKFTKRALETLPLPSGKQRDVYVDTDPSGASRREAVPGLQLTVSSSGTKSFVLCRKFKGRTKKVTIGRFPAWTVEQARNRAKDLAVQLNQGIDPIKKRREEKARGITLGEAMDEYLEVRGAHLSVNTHSNYRAVINKHLADWKEKPLSEISRDMVASKHRKLSAESESAANKAMRVLRAVFNFANGQYEDSEGRGLFPDNPVNRLSQTKSWNKEKRRENIISKSDLQAWFKAVIELSESEVEFESVTGDYLQFILLTGLRRREAAAIRVDDVDFREGVFKIPKTKNTKPLTLPLTEYVATLLRRRCERSPTNMVFPSKGDSGCIDDPRRLISSVRESSGVYFTIHDLRRTFITIADSVDISLFTIKRLVNHSLGNDVTAGYVVRDVERFRKPFEIINQIFLDHAEISVPTNTVREA
jgi:integrase